jgi:hypothetical protein
MQVVHCFSGLYFYGIRQTVRKISVWFVSNFITKCVQPSLTVIKNVNNLFSLDMQEQKS